MNYFNAKKKYKKKIEIKTGERNNMISKQM